MRAGSLKARAEAQSMLGAPSRVRMIRRISTKLVLAVLTAVVLPFVVFAFYVSEEMGARITTHVVQQALKGLATNLAERIDVFLAEREQDVVQWVDLPATRLAVDEFVAVRSARSSSRTASDWNAEIVTRWAREGPKIPDFDRASMVQRAQITREFDRYVELKNVYDVLLLVAADGRLVTTSTHYADGELLEPDTIAELFSRDFNQAPWFRAVMRSGQGERVDHHPSELVLPRLEQRADPAWRHEIGFAAPVKDNVVPGKVIGVLYAAVNWSWVQELASTPTVREYFRGLVEEEQEPSPYAWIWARDADTILGHPQRSLYYQSVSRDVELPEMTAAVNASEEGYGLFPEYEFRGKRKNAAFRRCSDDFGWVVGVGIDNDDIYATAYELRNLILGGTALVLVMAVMWTFLIARRTTDPILELQGHARRVAAGDLASRVSIPTQDELGALADDLNLMTRKLKEQQDELVRAEKDAAWREMARQVAHDLKNPLTPIRLSIDLLERARREQSADSEEILERTLELVRRQVANLQEIAGDFYEFTGGHKLKLESVDVKGLVDEVLHLHDAWAVELGVEIQRAGQGGTVRADRGKLRRVLVNLVSNALQAMPEGGQLFVESIAENGDVRVSIRDTGKGLGEEARKHLFEPYFTTKGEGTGLGLAISKQVVEQMGGTIEVVPAADGNGTVATVRLAEHGPA